MYIINYKMNNMNNKSITSNNVKPIWRISTFENVNKTHLPNIERIQRYINSRKYQKKRERIPNKQINISF